MQRGEKQFGKCVETCHPLVVEGIVFVQRSFGIGQNEAERIIVVDYIVRKDALVVDSYLVVGSHRLGE